MRESLLFSLQPAAQQRLHGAQCSVGFGARRHCLQILLWAWLSVSVQAAVHPARVAMTKTKREILVNGRLHTIQ